MRQRVRHPLRISYAIDKVRGPDAIPLRIEFSLMLSPQRNSGRVCEMSTAVNFATAISKRRLGAV